MCWGGDDKRGERESSSSKKHTGREETNKGNATVPLARAMQPPTPSAQHPLITHLNHQPPTQQPPHDTSHASLTQCVAQPAVDSQVENLRHSLVHCGRLIARQAVRVVVVEVGPEG